MKLIFFNGHKKAQKARRLRGRGLCVSCAPLWLSMIVSASVFQTLEAAEDLESLIKKGEIKAKVQEYSERVILDETVAADQARTKAQSRGEFGMELRPRISNNEVGAALRMYMPDGWSSRTATAAPIQTNHGQLLKNCRIIWRRR